MSHHFSPDFTVLPPGKEPVSKKLQQSNDQSNSARQRETQKLDFDNKQMEWKLNQIRQVMSKEKEGRGRQHNIWKSGAAKIESHSRNILGRTVSATTVNGKQKLSPKSGAKSAPKVMPAAAKVRVLRDEPLDLPERDSLAKDLIRRFNHEVPAQEKSSKKRDIETPKRLEYWIRFSVNKNSGDVMELQSDLQGNLMLSTVQAMEPSAVGIYFMKWGRKRLLIAADGVIRKPKTGWGDEIYYPYAAKPLSDMPRKPEPPLRNVSNTLPIIPSMGHGNNQNGGGGKLLEGDFDEERNAAFFQQALKEWRRSGQQGENAPVEESPKYSINDDGKVTEMSVHVAQCTPEPFEVKFSETSTLSYMEHVLLQKHRSSQVPPMPNSLLETVNGYLGNEASGDDVESEFVLTEEQEDERQRYRALFIPDKKDNNSELLSKTLTIDEIDSEEDLDATDQCVVVESPPQSPIPTPVSSQTVIIEEVSFDTTEFLESPISRELKYVTVSAPKRRESFIDSPSPKPTLHKTSNSAIDLNNEELKNIRSKSAKIEKGRSVSSKKPRTPRSKTVASHVPFDELMSDDRQGISQGPSALVQEIGKLPMNPDAVYHRGLDQFFVAEKKAQIKPHEFQQSRLNDFSEESTLAKVSERWNPFNSVVQSDRLCLAASSLADFENNHSSAKQDEEYDNSADEKALDDLEWELASRTGNITEDGRISRLIDEWSEDDDLEIIDDPGVGSGLSTPNPRSNCLSRLSVTDPSDPQLQYDFENMEHMIMTDMSDEYIGDGIGDEV